MMNILSHIGCCMNSFFTFHDYRAIDYTQTKSVKRTLGLPVVLKVYFP
ncbi:hypothetical protein [Sutcliffiella horikoshii]|nr:hypothetical protein [Sutcliffiella horikoshii]